VSIHLSPNTESLLARAAEARGTTPDILAEELLLEQLQPEAPGFPTAGNGDGPRTLVDFLEGYIGVFDSREDFPGGETFSVDTGKRFAEGMRRKHEQGRL
jgi:hypothetical protein